MRKRLHLPVKQMADVRPWQSGGHRSSYRPLAWRRFGRIRRDGAKSPLWLVEDSGRATPWETPRLGPWKATPAAEPLLPAASRVVLLQPAPLPQQLVCRDLEGVERPIVEHLSGSRQGC